tara:strand:- start:2839 stop:4179 length:1341 start_codon:yes stop_codon:yes gene_type:complete
MAQKKISICGAGLVGSLLAIYLGKRGHQVELFERRPDMRANLIDGGRSINLAMSNRGWKALDGVGVGEEIRKISIPMYRRVMHDKEGNLSFQAYGKEGQAIYSVSRAGLNARLMDLAESTGNANINFNEKCSSVDFDTASASFTNYETGESKTIESDLVFGTDGAFSAVRGAFQKTDRFNYAQEYIEHGYKELSIPPNEDGSHKMEKEALHIWPRGNYMLIALPNPDGSFTCTLFFPFEGKPSFSQLDSTEKARKFFEEEFSDALELMPDFNKEWEENPTSSLVIIRCYPWVKNNKISILGDASHAIVPFYGQGMNSGFEDCTILEELLSEHGENWDLVLDKFQKSRKPNADAIADLAMRNFVEMRDLTADPDFLLRKKIENRFYSKYPEKWMPLYSMVTFSHIPYSEALKEGLRQDEIMEKIMAIPDIENKWDSMEVEEMMIKLC